MISSEMAELLGMADRVYVMCDGKLRGEITEKEEMTQARVMGLSLIHISGNRIDFRKQKRRRNSSEL